jgi:DNA-binding transcriptional MerR regulator
MGKSDQAFRTISEVASELDVPQHVLRFWEGRFAQIHPLKRAGGRRYYRPEDVDILKRIRDLLYHEGYTIKGVQKLLREGGAKGLAASSSLIEPDRPAEPSAPAPFAQAKEPQFALSLPEAPQPKGLPHTARSALESILADLLDLKAALERGKPH